MQTTTEHTAACNTRITCLSSRSPVIGRRHLVHSPLWTALELSANENKIEKKIPINWHARMIYASLMNLIRNKITYQCTNYNFQNVMIVTVALNFAKCAFECWFRFKLFLYQTNNGTVSFFSLPKQFHENKLEISEFSALIGPCETICWSNANIYLIRAKPKLIIKKWFQWHHQSTVQKSQISLSWKTMEVNGIKKTIFTFPFRVNSLRCFQLLLSSYFNVTSITDHLSHDYRNSFCFNCIDSHLRHEIVLPNHQLVVSLTMKTKSCRNKTEKELCIQQAHRCEL